MSIIIIIQDQEDTRKIPVKNKPYLLGRSSKCDLKIQDPMVSGKHCSFQLDPSGRATIKDLGSSNGTFVNGSKVSETPLMMDDEVKIGGVKCWLDASQMNPKEKNLHLREGSKTIMKFIDLGDNDKKRQKKAATNPSKETGSQHKNFDPKTSVIEVDLDAVNSASDEDFKRTEATKIAEKEDIQSKNSNDRLANLIRQNKSNSINQTQDSDLSRIDENQFENEVTGQTKFLKIDKVQNKKPKAIIKKKVNEKKESNDNEGFLGKIKGILKKKS
jgi:predicted component of type VI protein secretion system